ncbi:conserved protein of unknown function [Methanoculleus bourgensis]|uniref:Uncharacterized protein n=1 Tax=Methanoculleus bourgensis TaxID=83986 RepID=A0A0X3BPF2_9EURY|nr:conserved protein of unknown function [Methanoculleus bourgensis]
MGRRISAADKHRFPNLNHRTDERRAAAALLRAHTRAAVFRRATAGMRLLRQRSLRWCALQWPRHPKYRSPSSLM